MRKYQYHWRKIPLWDIPTDFTPKTKVTVVIPARNEEDNIEKCLSSICKQDYPLSLYQVILVNDHSTDNTLEVAKSLAFSNLSIINLEAHDFDESVQSFKKKGIELAIAESQGDLIVTTDADCIVSEKWLSYLVSFYESKRYRFIAAPVNFYDEKNVLERFQSLDFVGMMGITGAGIAGGFMRMCNGANLAYERSVFYAVEGFKGIDDLASGDDMLLMQKVAKQFPGSIGYLKNPSAKTITKAQPTIERFIAQRVRWASKSSVYPEWQVTFTLAMVFFFSWNIVLTLLLTPFFGWLMFGLFLFQFMMKSLIDYLFLGEMASFFYRKDLMRSFWSAQIFHICYIAVIGLMANLTNKYTWKGRVVK